MPAAHFVQVAAGGRRYSAPMVTLPPMSTAEWTAWREQSIRDYAADKVRIGAWSADEAVERATNDFARLLPDGQVTPGHEFRSITNETGAVVGALWFGRSDELAASTAFIWDISVDIASRGRGYGRAALSALEPIARELGYDSIRLHVFGDNEVARNLYRTAGYVETDVSMLRRLGAEGTPP